MPQRLLNKVAVVTGAAGLWGRAFVKRFLAEGAKVVVFDRDRAALDELSERATARVLVVEGEVTRSADLETLVATTVRRFGGVDVLVFAAEDDRKASLAECTPEFVSASMAFNFQSALETVRLFERHLNRGASVIFVTTPPAVAARPGLGPFAASKAAVGSLARTLASELSPRGIRVNCVAPPQGDASEQTADAALFLASDESAGITGQEIVVATAG
jgi:NAD(P)-dependent dehydrogenase (short-subunit alcohol dehydrogenase family)